MCRVYILTLTEFKDRIELNIRAFDDLPYSDTWTAISMGNKLSVTSKHIESQADGDTYMSKDSASTSRSPPSGMSMTFDVRAHTGDDFSQENLMGLQELDSHLALYEQVTNQCPTSLSPTPPPLSTDVHGPFVQDVIDVSTNLPNVDVAEDSPVQEFFPVEDPDDHLEVEDSSDGASPAVPIEFWTATDCVGQTPIINVQEAQDNGTSSLTLDNHPSIPEFEQARKSLTSSTITDHSEVSSALSSLSSKATSPSGLDLDTQDSFSLSRVSRTKSAIRQNYDVRPKVSIPNDLDPQEYARQCIAAAESSRLHPYSLHPDEYALLRDHITHAQVTTYLNIRNGILRLWVRNPLIGVMRDEAIGCAKDTRWFDVAHLCYEWLARNGYINFGCVENVNAKPCTARPRPAKRKRRTVVIVGAGMSGLGCGRQLEGLFSQFEDRFAARGESQPKVIVLEGRDRIGGRVYSHGLKSKPTGNMPLRGGARCTAEMGGQIITGFDRGNPLNIIVRGQLALPYHALRPTTTLYDSDGQPVNAHRDQLVERLHNDILDRVSDYKFKSPQPKTLDGDKLLINIARDPAGDRTAKTISVSENIASLQTKDSTVNNSGPTPTMVPVSSDRLTGRAHVEAGVAAVHKAAYKAKMMGWALKSGVDVTHDLNLESAVDPMRKPTLGSVMDFAIDQYRDVVDITPQDLRLINWHIANLEYSNAINYSQLSLGGWDLDAGNEWEGKHTMIIGGYQQVPRGLLNCPDPLDVKKSSVVKRITYSTRKEGAAKIECEDGTMIDADYIVSTVPLGVLKQESVQFEPALPDWKIGAIHRLGFGVLNKIVLVFKKPFWDERRDIFGVLRNASKPDSVEQKDYSTRRGRFFQWFNCTKTSGLPVLVALMAGDAAFQVENSTNEFLVKEAVQVLQQVYGSAVTHPVEAIVTRWGHDAFARGSYSFAGPDIRPDDYEVMARSIGNLFFAGEHTCGTHPATVHGAYLSGLRAASEVLESILGPIVVPEPLILPKENNTFTASNKRKASGQPDQPVKDPKQARLEAYDWEIWNAMYAKIGDRPWRPAKISANPYIFYGKEKYEIAKKICEEGRRPGKGRGVANEVRVALAKMWKEATPAEKKPYTDLAEAEKLVYAAALKTYNEASAMWDRDAAEFREQYIKAHPSVPGPDETPAGYANRGRRVKRHSGYAENSGSELGM